jgi:hypothetical protein
MTVTIEEVRKILGKKYDKLPDKEIEGIINLFSLYAKLAISEHIAEKRARIKAEISGKSSLPTLNKERHLANKMPLKATLDQKINRHIAHVANCKCRPIPDKIKQEIQKRLG